MTTLDAHHMFDEFLSDKLFVGEVLIVEHLCMVFRDKCGVFWGGLISPDDC